MSNLKKPYFWAYLFIVLYMICFSLTGMMTMPYLLIKVIYGVVGVILSYSVLISFRRSASDKWYVGLTFMFVGAVFIFAGVSLLNELLNPLHPVNHYEYTQWFKVLPVLATIMALCGILSVLFSMTGLISNGMHGKLKDNSSLFQR